jgi:hydroxypyruvate isomerase
MPRFSANLSFLFGERPFLERFAAAADAGFDAVEYMFPYEHPAAAIRERLDDAGLRQVLFNLPAGDWGAGDRGIAADPARIDEFREGIEPALHYAAALDVPRMNCLAGTKGDRATLVGNVRLAAQRLAADGRTLLVEPVNTTDIPGFLVATAADAERLLDEVGADNVALQLDLYHAHMEGERDLEGLIERVAPRTGHVQIADSPGRHQPGTGEIDFDAALGRLDAVGYAGHVGLEYVPEPDTLASLAWLDRYRQPREP